jgi:hypothetical protein
MNLNKIDQSLQITMDNLNELVDLIDDISTLIPDQKYIDIMKVLQCSYKHQPIPPMVTVQVGSDPSSTYVNQRADGYAVYQTTALDNAGVYDSGILDLQGFTQIEIELYSDQTGSLVGTWYLDAAGFVPARSYTCLHTKNQTDYYLAPVIGRYLRYKYTNNATPQTTFLLGLRFLTKSPPTWLEFDDKETLDSINSSNTDILAAEGVSNTIGIESTVNTTVTPLGSGLTYTGTWEQNDYSDVMVVCITDNTGTLYFDFSVDGSNTNTFPVSGFQVASGDHELHTTVKGSRYFRARLVNDSGAQSYLRLTTYFGKK